MSHFFIDRPIFASVLAIVMTLLGSICLILLPIEQYPEIAPPTVNVTTNYPGADPQTIVDTVTAPIEQEVNGVEDMIYMKSTTAANGNVSLNVTFKLGTDPDLATVNTQNRVAIAEPRLPEEVRSRGVKTAKRSPSLLMVIGLISPDGSADQLTLSNYGTLYVRDALARVDGVSDVFAFGAQDYAMRIWLDPDKLASRDLVTTDVLGALRDQNVQVAAGRVGAEPASTDSGFQLTVNTEGRLTEPEQFGEIILKTGEDQRVVYLRDVAEITVGADSYDWSAQLSQVLPDGQKVLGQPAAMYGIYQLPGSNALSTADGVKAALEELSVGFPENITYTVAFDFTDFVVASVEEVVTTLFIAVGLVILITWIFMQDWRATLVPVVVIPVSLIATFAVMLAMGFTLNLFTLFGLILAIGIVVDDAIVVVENTIRRLDEGLDGNAAAKETMTEVSGALVATTLVVLAVFIPAACLPGLTGVLYRQFALTIAVATLFSTVNALTLSPALCAILLRPSKKTKFPLFTGFNFLLNGSRTGYLWLVDKSIRVSVITVLVFAGFCALAVVGFRVVPTGFLPDEDQGYMFVNMQLPNAAKLSRTASVVSEVEQIVMDTPGVRRVVAITGYSILDGTISPNKGTAIVILDPWDDRTSKETQLNAIVGSIAMKVGRIEEAQAFPFTPPPVMGLGTAGGFSMELQDRSASGLDVLMQTADEIVAAGNADPKLTRLFSGFQSRTPQLFLDIDRVKAQQLGVAMPTVFDTLSTNLGGSYVNDFNLFNRVYRVYAQADADFRAQPDDIGLLQVRNADGSTLPLDTLLTVEEITGPDAIFRFNLYPSASITGSPAPGVSSGQSVQEASRIAREEMPPGFGFAWSGMTYQELAAGNAAPLAFGLGFVLVYLVLAAQYESWTIPVAILMTVPLGVLGALAGVLSRGLDNNTYTQVGFVLLIALVAKNAILIVEFAKQLHEGGKSVVDSAKEAARLRYRPILMTAFSFVLGTLPLVIATGAGAASRVSLGTAVFFGMIVATCIGVVFVPTFYTVIQSISEKLGRKPAKATPEATPRSDADPAGTA
ncbi:MAG: multidrug efflux RND transporter permease subunit [Planctomycetota bacterium]